MKLLIITAVAEFDKDVKEILKQADVKTFTYKEVKGHRDHSSDIIEGNWFAGEITETASTLFYVFIKKEKVDTVFDLAEEFNKKQETVSKIHVAVLNIEKSN
jgi:nitrogen regulatory protein PII